MDTFSSLSKAFMLPLRKVTKTIAQPASVADKTIFGLVLYNSANFYRFEESSSYWSVKGISVFSLLFIGQPATHLRHHSV